eukprot:4935597-Prymnesium_polylepis.1
MAPPRHRYRRRGARHRCEQQLVWRRERERGGAPWVWRGAQHAHGHGRWEVAPDVAEAGAVQEGRLQ